MQTGSHRWRRLLALALAIGLPVAVAACSGGDRTAPRRPNVLLVVIDTTRADALSSYANDSPATEPRSTPSLDRLAREGARFTRVFSTSFWTLPSHASLFTGRYSTEVGATAETNRLPGAAHTLAERFSQAGYRTAAFVSNSWVSRERGFDQGFETFVESWRPQYDLQGPLGVDRASEKLAARWMRDRARLHEPFFVFVNLLTPHLPYEPDPKVLDELGAPPLPADRTPRLRGLAGMWPYLAGRVHLDARDFEILRTLYHGDVYQADALVGRLVSELEEAGVLDDTVVVVTSDHGENIGDHGLIDHLLSMYDSTLHVPLIVRYPPLIEPGRVDTRLASTVDIVPTILAACGIPPGGDLGDARDLLDPRAGGRDFVYAENERPVNAIQLLAKEFPDFDRSGVEGRQRALRSGRYKLIWEERSGSETGPWPTRLRLYDVEADPGELHDLAGQHPKLRDELWARLQAWMARPEARGPGGEDSEAFQGGDPAALERLRALGYVE